jgi:N-acetylmuramoyl-L-alanine amidase
VRGVGRGRIGRCWIASLALAGALAPGVVGAARAPSGHPDRALYLEAQAARQRLSRSPKLPSRRAEWDKVIARYRRIVGHYPQSGYSDNALLAVGDLLHEMSTRFKDAHLGEEATKNYNLLVSEYPSSSLGEQALFAAFQIARDGKNQKALKAAGERYLENYPDGANARAVRTALRSVKAVPAAVTRAPAHTGLVRLCNLRAWSGDASTRVVLDLDKRVNFQRGRVDNPDRLFIDLLGTRLHPNLKSRTFPVGDGLLQQVRIAQFSDEVVRVVLDFKDIASDSIFYLEDPVRLVVDVRAPSATGAAEERRENIKIAEAVPQPVVDNTPTPPSPTPSPSAVPTPVSASTPSPERTPAAARDGKGTPTTPAPTPSPSVDKSAEKSGTVGKAGETKAAAKVADVPVKPEAGASGSKDASRASKASETVEPKPSPSPAERHVASATVAEPGLSTGRASETPVTDDWEDADRPPRTAEAQPPGAPVPPRPNRSGAMSISRQLGLGARRIVIDAGHGGHDPGTIGRSGLQEKDLVLDVALRLEKLVRQRLGVDVIMTRSTDVFIPLEERTAIANSKGADLFLSIHVNSSRSPSASGVETYYLNFAVDAHAEEVAARENAISPATLKDLTALVKAITQNAKIEESRDFAASVQQAMTTALRPRNRAFEDRGVRRAPFYVLLGANMPSILAEIAFVSHRGEETLLRSSDYRDAIAEGLLDGVRRYLEALNANAVRQLTSRQARPRVTTREARR